MASRHLLLLGLVLAVVCIGSVDAKMITVGQGTDIWSMISPWAYGVSSWKQPIVVPGDVLVFRWIGMRNVRQWATPLGYTACWFGFAKTVAPQGYWGMIRYTVAPSEARTTLYFGSSIGDDCARNIKVRINVS
ncbi:unnamed protein product [Closterium sp. Yama58-4]|nr:unnamed protein product [Closterium sp. Yama58-4]